MGKAFDDLKREIQNQRIIKKLQDNRIQGQIYLVGGAIRELCLSGSPNDFDLALSNMDDMGAIEDIIGTGAFVRGKRPLQTYRIIKKGLSVDITFLESTIDKDLSRRDFTMNAIAYDIKRGVIIDPLNGIGHIGEGIIRYTHKEAIMDDPLRMVKAIRHFSVMEGFSMDDELLIAIKDIGPHIRFVAPERIKYEIDRIVISKRAWAGLKVLEETGLLFEIFPELLRLKELDIEKGFTLETLGHTIDGFRYLAKYGNIYNIDATMLQHVGYALLFHDLGKASTFSYDEEKKAVHFFFHERVSLELSTGIMERLKFSNNEMRTILKLIDNHMRIFLISNSESTEKATRRLVYKMGDLTPPLIVLSLCDMYGSSRGTDNPSTERVHEKCRELMEAYNEWKRKPLPKLINGHDLIALGFREGPPIGVMLNKITEKQIAGEITDIDEAIRYAESFLKSRTGDRL